MEQGNGFTIFRRTDGSEVACRIEHVLYVGKGERGAVLHFSGGNQVNVHENFDEVMAMFAQSAVAF